MRSVIFRHHLFDYVAVDENRLRRVVSDSEARQMAEAIVAQEEWPAPDTPGAPPRVDRVTRAIVDGRIRVFRLDDPPRRLDAPRTVDLVELARPDGADGIVEPPRPTAWVEVVVVDQRGRALPFFVAEIEGPKGVRYERKVAADGTAKVDELAEDGSCTVTLTPTGERQSG